VSLRQTDRQKVPRALVEGLTDAVSYTAKWLKSSLGPKVIAQGVENNEQLALLRGMHCDWAHGHYFSKPLSSEVAGELLAKGFLSWIPPMLAGEGADLE
jgi:EAL domain-containing protein (putative c-di-GMP-specific phosphodiesterase class I)